MPLPARNPSTNAAPTAGGVPDESARPSRCSTRAAVPVAGVVQQPGGPPLDETVRASVGELTQHVGEPGVPRRMVDQRERGLHAAQALDHHPRRGVVERCARDDDAGQHPHDQAVEHRAQRRHVGGAHVAVALRLGERTERRHQLADVGIVGGPRRELDDDRLDRQRQMGEQRQIEGGRELEEPVGVRRPLDEPVRGRLLDGGAVPGELDEADRQLGLPRDPPRLAERPARAAALLERTPSDAERDELVQEVRPGEPVRRAQVELDHGDIGTWLQPHPALPDEQVAGERHLRRTRRDLADRLADDQAPPHERQAAHAPRRRSRAPRRDRDAGDRAGPTASRPSATRR